MKRWSSEDPQGGEIALCGPVMMETCHHTSVQSHRRYHLKRDPDVDSGFWVMMTCQCRFVNRNKGTKRWGLIVGSLCMPGGAGGILSRVL